MCTHYFTKAGKVVTEIWDLKWDTNQKFGKCKGDKDIEDFIEGFSTKTVENPNFKYQIVVTDDGFVSTDHIEGSTYKTDAKFGIAASNAFDSKFRCYFSVLISHNV